MNSLAPVDKLAFKIFKRVGNVSESTREQFIQELDEDGDKEVSIESLLDWARPSKFSSEAVEGVLTSLRAQLQKAGDEELQKAFARADKDGSMSLSHREIRRLIKKLIGRIPQRELRIFTTAVDSTEDDGGNGEITFEELMSFVHPFSCDGDISNILERLRQKLLAMSTKRLKQVFRKCDADDSGSLEYQDVRRLVRKLIGKIENSVMEALVSSISSNGSVTFDKFIAFIKGEETPKPGQTDQNVSGNKNADVVEKIRERLQGAGREQLQREFQKADKDDSGSLVK